MYTSVHALPTRFGSLQSVGNGIGLSVGAKDGFEVLGDKLGVFVGERVGIEVPGDTLGIYVGSVTL